MASDIHNDLEQLKEFHYWNSKIYCFLNCLYQEASYVKKTEDIYSIIAHLISTKLSFQKVILFQEIDDRMIPIACQGYSDQTINDIYHYTQSTNITAKSLEEHLSNEMKLLFDVKHSVTKWFEVRGQSAHVLLAGGEDRIPSFFKDQSFPIICNQIELAIENYEVNQNFEQMELFAKENADLVQRMEERVQQRTIELKEALETLQETQGQLIQSEKMAALGQLVAGVAHEINTPIGLGVTASSFLQQKTDEFENVYQNNQMKRSHLDNYLQDVKESIKIINSNLQKGADLIKSFKQVAVDQSSQAFREFNLYEYVEEVITSLKPSIRKYNPQIIINCNKDLQINSQPGAISQIFTNLIMNSLIHGFEKLEREKVITISIEKKDNSMIMTYRDNGHGIALENLQKIFDPFFTTKRTTGGSGLGLHIIYNIVTQTLKGTITCESNVNQGVMFQIQIPL
ncbi:sensor histidine kinase [Bacillus sp. CGMCC 1.16607]|uniref:sensor histidine kinase n=1 Tax=Bacillus sp. CGMCC 1.16607 TaxID=3351842 RepID=UPI00362E0824